MATAFLCAAGLAASGSFARAAVLQADQSVTIAAPPATVWGIIRNFGQFTWHPAVKASEATQDNTPGSTRTLDLGGPKLVEQLTAYDPTSMSYSYRITDDPNNVKTLPVTGYSSTLAVGPGPDHGSIVTWHGSFMRADRSDNPKPGMDDATATKAVTGVYRAGLDALKRQAEAE